MPVDAVQATGTEGIAGTHAAFDVMGWDVKGWNNGEFTAVEKQKPASLA